jgi:hypothetical protein
MSTTVTGTSSTITMSTVNSTAGAAAFFPPSELLQPDEGAAFEQEEPTSGYVTESDGGERYEELEQ